MLSSYMSSKLKTQEFLYPNVLSNLSTFIRS